MYPNNTQIFFLSKNTEQKQLTIYHNQYAVLFAASASVINFR